MRFIEETVKPYKQNFKIQNSLARKYKPGGNLFLCRYREVVKFNYDAFDILHLVLYYYVSDQKVEDNFECQQTPRTWSLPINIAS